MQIEGSEGGAPSEQSALDRLAWKPFERREAAKRQAEPAWHEYTSAVFVTGKQGEQVPHKETRSCNFCATACNGRAVWVEHILGDNYRARKGSSVKTCTASMPGQVKEVALEIYKDARGTKQQGVQVRRHTHC
jgi:hypothetical protein